MDEFSRSLGHSSLTMSRRRFAGFWGGASLAVAANLTATAGFSLNAAAGINVTRRLPLNNAHTGEELDITYFSDGVYHLNALAEIDHFMRDWRNDKTIRLDPSVLDLLAAILAKLEISKPVQILSGYRSPETNEMLRRRGRKVAKNSLHMQGMAIDFYCLDRSLKEIRNIAWSFKAGGVGYYPRSGFVHIDTGSIRYW